MIKNERQYRIASVEAEHFEKALSSRPDRAPHNSETHPDFWTAERDAMREQLAELRAEIEQFEALCSGERTVFMVADLGELPRALIEARIAMGLTQKDLATRIGLPEQAIQRYEATDYASASLERLREVARALSVEIAGAVALGSLDLSPLKFFSRLKAVGLDRAFVLDRLLTPQLSAVLAAQDNATDLVQGCLLQAAVIVNRVLGIGAEALFGSQPLDLDLAIVGATRYKRVNRANRSARLVTAADTYTVYAHYLALLALQASRGIAHKELPPSPRMWRDQILQSYGAFDLSSVLRFIWSHGIPVLPLRDSGNFHGACWRIDGREVIVLKQKSLSEEKWLFDALHESGHIVDEVGTSFSIIESEMPRAADPREQRATLFAANALLDGRADELCELAVDEAKGYLPSLKQAAKRIASSAGVPLGAFANYLAYRVEEDTGENWWSTAAVLQNTDSDPWRLARDLFLEHADLSRLNANDRSILIRAMALDEQLAEVTA